MVPVRPAANGAKAGADGIKQAVFRYQIALVLIRLLSASGQMKHGCENRAQYGCTTQ
jgi:hypothetical protein